MPVLFRTVHGGTVLVAYGCTVFVASLLDRECHPDAAFYTVRSVHREVVFSGSVGQRVQDKLTVAGPNGINVELRICRWRSHRNDPFDIVAGERLRVTAPSRNGIIEALPSQVRRLKA